MHIFLGKHGDRVVAALPMKRVVVMTMDSYYLQCSNCRDWHNKRNRIVCEAEDSTQQIINYYGSTYLGIGMSLARNIGTILQVRNSVLTISTYFKGTYDLHDIS